MRSVSGVGRVAAVAAVLVAALLVGIFLFGSVGGGGYSVNADFLNAGQLVKGNLVEVAGVKAGAVKGISITPNGQARIDMKIDGKYKPLPEGTRAVIRMASQTGIANRYIELDMPGGAKHQTIPSGGHIASDQTTTAVDLDQLFNTLDPKTRKALQGFFKGSAEQFQGVTQEANVGLHYLNPALATSSRLFNELNRDTPVLEHFIGDSAHLVSAVAEKRDDLSALVANLNTTTRAIGDEKASLADAIGRLPDFMRQANTTFVNVRGALTDVNPLVNASKPVAKKLKPFLDQVQPLAQDARPTVAGLNTVIARAQPDNDLIDLTNTLTPLAHVAVDSDKRNGATRDGAFPETSKALVGSSPVVGQGRPYTPDLFGWFDDFSTTGGYDALGSISRTQTMFNANSPDIGGLITLPSGITLQPGQPLNIVTDQFPTKLPAEVAGEVLKNFSRINQFRRCPGGGDVVAPDRSNVLSPQMQQELGCKESDRGAGDFVPGG
jgi:phospholipid/cholesterol/gamma-HCH transport system substrate-binding protein